MATHRCEAKEYGLTRTLKTGGRVARTTRCPSTDTQRAVLDPRCDHYATYVERGESEAWYCETHKRQFDGSAGIGKWMAAQ